MALTIQAQSLPIKARQTIQACTYAKFLGVEIDIRHNNCLLWILQDDEKEEPSKHEDVDILMCRLNEKLEPVNAKYVGFFKNNSGVVHVFALRASERMIVYPASVAVEAASVSTP